jgi:CIC family chloride channel protein
MGTAIGVGLGTGVGAVIFIRLIAWVQEVLFGTGATALGFLGRIPILLVPAVGGLLAGPIIYYFAKEAKGHGVPEVMQAMILHGGRIRPRVVVAKVIASALCIGSGGSAGREGPIVQVGAALGSTFGQWLHMSEARMRNLAACGVAAGIAATFNAPIAGVVFPMEIILGEFRLVEMGNVVLSAITASTVSRIFLGERPAFTIPQYEMRTPWEVVLYGVLGVFAALVAVGFIRMLYGVEEVFDRWRFPDVLKPAVGGLLLGGLGFFYPMVLGLGFVPREETLLGLPLMASIPHVFGSGFPVIEGALLGRLSLILLIVLVLLKPLATSLTLGSGNSGGVFAPALFSGAVLGGAFGWLVEQIAPGATAGIGAFATVGMAAVFAGAAHAPFTAFLIVFEMTDDYRLILPLMTGVVVSTFLSRRLNRESIYTTKLALRGIHLERGRDIDVMESVRVNEVMVSEPVSIRSDMPVSQLAGEFIRTGRHGFPVLYPDGSLMGVVSLEDYRRATASESPSEEVLLVQDIATRDPVTIFPEDTVGTALARMAPRDISRLPVVDRDNPRRLVGIVRRNDIVRAYEIALTRRTALRQRVLQKASRHAGGIDEHEVLLNAGSPLAGRRVQEVRWPEESVIAMIWRGEESMIPHGNTVLKPGDMLVIVGYPEEVEEIREMCRSAVSP